MAVPSPVVPGIGNQITLRGSVYGGGDRQSAQPRLGAPHAVRAGRHQGRIDPYDADGRATGYVGRRKSMRAFNEQFAHVAMQRLRASHRARMLARGAVALTPQEVILRRGAAHAGGRDGIRSARSSRRGIPNARASRRPVEQLPVQLATGAGPAGAMYARLSKAQREACKHAIRLDGSAADFLAAAEMLARHFARTWRAPEPALLPDELSSRLWAPVRVELVRVPGDASTRLPPPGGAVASAAPAEHPVSLSRQLVGSPQLPPSLPASPCAAPAETAGGSADANTLSLPSSSYSPNYVSGNNPSGNNPSGGSDSEAGEGRTVSVGTANVQAAAHQATSLASSVHAGGDGEAAGVDLDGDGDGDEDSILSEASSVDAEESAAATTLASCPEHLLAGSLIDGSFAAIVPLAGASAPATGEHEARAPITGNEAQQTRSGRTLENENEDKDADEDFGARAGVRTRNNDQDFGSASGDQSSNSSLDDGHSKHDRAVHQQELQEGHSGGQDWSLAPSHSGHGQHSYGSGSRSGSSGSQAAGRSYCSETETGGVRESDSELRFSDGVPAGKHADRALIVPLKTGHDRLLMHAACAFLGLTSQSVATGGGGKGISGSSGFSGDGGSGGDSGGMGTATAAVKKLKLKTGKDQGQVASSMKFVEVRRSSLCVSDAAGKHGIGLQELAAESSGAAGSAELFWLLQARADASAAARLVKANARFTRQGRSSFRRAIRPAPTSASAEPAGELPPGVSLLLSAAPVATAGGSKIGATAARRSHSVERLRSDRHAGRLARAEGGSGVRGGGRWGVTSVTGVGHQQASQSRSLDPSSGTPAGAGTPF